MYLVAGIDPGKAGGWAVFDADNSRLIKAGRLNFDNPKSLFDELWDVNEILIERAQGAAGQAHQFEYGRGFGRTEAACMMTGAKIYYCAASWWKAKLSIPADKNAAVEKALRLFPAAKEFVLKKADDGVAEAILIASTLLDDALVSDLKKNNLARVSRMKPKKRVSFRL